MKTSNHRSPDERPRALVLASASPRRVEIMRSAGLTFQVRPSKVDEDAFATNHAPAELAVRLARAKALAVAELHVESTVVGADTLVVLDGQVLGKPRDDEEARLMLARLRARQHEVITGVAVIARGTAFTGSRSTRVSMRDYSDSEVDSYIRSGLPRDKAGAYGIQDLGFSPVASVDGCRLNVVGLPLCLLDELLRQLAEPPVGRRIECPSCPVQRMAAAR